MNYQETLDYLYSQLPMYSRIGAAAYKKDLDNTIALCNLLDNPQRHFKSIHIAGTNGKGSTSHMLSAILQKAGYKTGLYTSPHLKDFRERIRINGEMISKDFVVSFVEKYKRDFERIQPSFFEMSVGLCFECFKEEKVDIAVIETGLGGRLDSTNIITPVLSLITNISWDHKDLLGDTLEKIAFEKAGIIKPGVPAVIGEKKVGIEKVFRRKAIQVNAPLFFANDQYEVTDFKQEAGLLNISVLDKDSSLKEDYQLDLLGHYQLKNILGVLASVQQLRKAGFTIPEETVLFALQHVKQLTGLRGRWDILADNPLTIADVGHNEAGITEILQQLKLYGKRHIHFVLGFVKEKDISTILKLLPKEQTYYFCKPDIERGLDENILQSNASEFSLNGKAYPSVNEAITAAKQNAAGTDIVFIGGSTFVVAEAI